MHRTFQTLLLVATSSLVLMACAPRFEASSRTPNASESRLITTDIERFWKAYDEAKTSSDPASVFQREYLNKGTQGLQEFLEKRIQNATQLATVVQTRRKYFDSIRQTTLQLARDAALKDQIHANFAALQRLYPEATFPDTYFLIGRFNSGGTTGQTGLLIGTEFYARTAESPLEELTPWERVNTQPISKLPFLVTHEMVHTLQAPAPLVRTLLYQSLHEGAADYLADLASGERPTGPYFQYGSQNEKRLWTEFEAVMNGTDTSNWLYQGDRIKDRPADLGYFIGYRVVQAYFERASDKRQAVRDILEVRDPAGFLNQSGYREKVKGL